MINTKEFFKQSQCLDYLALKQLAHIKGNWDITWNDELEKYEPEENSYAEQLNQLIEELGQVVPPQKYHLNEDCLAEYSLANSTRKIKKVNTRWIGEYYPIILEQGGFNDISQKNLVLAAVGRIKAAIDKGQNHFDDMEQAHQKMLAELISIILYHRSN